MAVDLETFDNPAPQRDYEIVHTIHEFTSLCPKTGHPDFGRIVVTYVPGASCVELKSLKLYFQAYRTKGVFYEALVNQVLDDLVGAMKPRRLHVRGEFTGRGGLSTTVIAQYPPT